MRFLCLQRKKLRTTINIKWGNRHGVTVVWKHATMWAVLIEEVSILLSDQTQLSGGCQKFRTVLGKDMCSALAEFCVQGGR
jgi:hypothetical protein